MKVRNDKKLTPETIANLVAEKASKRYQEKYVTIKENLANSVTQKLLLKLAVIK